MLVKQLFSSFFTKLLFKVHLNLERWPHKNQVEKNVVFHTAVCAMRRGLFRPWLGPTGACQREWPHCGLSRPTGLEALKQTQGTSRTSRERAIFILSMALASHHKKILSKQLNRSHIWVTSHWAQCETLCLEEKMGENPPDSHDSRRRIIGIKNACHFSKFAKSIGFPLCSHLVKTKSKISCLFFPLVLIKIVL